MVERPRCSVVGNSGGCCSRTRSRYPDDRIRAVTNTSKWKPTEVERETVSYFTSPYVSVAISKPAD